MNNPVIKLVIVLAVLLGAAGFGVSKYQSKTSEYDHKLGLERIRKEFLERAPFARLMPGQERYQEEQRALWKWYFDELTGHYNKYPGLKNYERFLDELIERKTKRKIKEQEFAQYEERYELVKSYWDTMQAGKYLPVFTGLDNGLRFDIYEMRPIPDAREPRVRLQFTLLGTQRKWNVESSSGGGRIMKMNVNASFHELVFKGFDAEGKPAREMRASGDPFKLDYPERFIDEFPPGVVIGYYELPRVPSVVTKAELSFEIATRSVISGEEIVGRFTWKLDPVPEELKLPPGMAWEGAEEQILKEEGAEE
ncbi:MAG TPA: hypothetical protein DFS52_12780 [Myxococcales bacterium]|mgnify:CR=1 FL=1|jgi:hypothetical protein|nr:hypothetical protein [Myxococcales bacterium]